MAYADYTCTFCGLPHVEYREGGEGFPDHFRGECTDCSADHGYTVQTTFKRVWTSPAIGAVPGAGGSPSRKAGR